MKKVNHTRCAQRLRACARLIQEAQEILEANYEYDDIVRIEASNALMQISILRDLLDARAAHEGLGAGRYVVMDGVVDIYAHLPGIEDTGQGA